MKESKVKASTHKHSAKAASYSRTGLWLSVICAVHCMAMPVVAAALPALSTTLHDHEWVEFLLLAAGFAIGVFSVLKGYGRHKRILPALLMIPALALVGAELAELTGEMHFFLPLGAGFAAVSQLINIRYSRNHITCDC